MEIVRIFRELGVEVDGEPAADVAERVASLAREKNIAAHDAACLELAARNGVALASQDGALLRAAASFGVKTLG
jgi:predicted nucleic acid-binding protein